jgi:hypothetical protein
MRRSSRFVRAIWANYNFKKVGETIKEFSMKLFLVSVLIAASFAFSPSAVEGQWLDYPTPNVPKTPDGKPNLSAPTPRTSDGKPDFVGPVGDGAKGAGWGTG